MLRFAAVLVAVACGGAMTPSVAQRAPQAPQPVIVTPPATRAEQRTTPTTGTEALRPEALHHLALNPGETFALHFLEPYTSVFIDTEGVVDVEPPTLTGDRRVVLKAIADPLKPGPATTRVFIYGLPKEDGERVTPYQRGVVLWDADVTVVPPRSSQVARVFSSGGLRRPWYYECVGKGVEGGGVVFPCKRIDETQATFVPEENKTEQIIHQDYRVIPPGQ